MRDLLATFLIACLIVAVFVIIKNGQVPSSEQVAPHSNQEVVDAPCPVDKNQKWVEGKVIGCESSSNGKLTAKFFYNGLSVPDRYYELFVVDTTSKRVKKIWAGDFRTLGWDWRKDNKIEVRYNCGSGCQAIKIMNMNESASIVDYRDGGMSEGNGWVVN